MAVEEVIAFDWNLLITALTGLGGVAVGGFVTWKIQERQLKHVDDNRFQEKRMGIYKDLISAANIAISKYVTGQELEGNEHIQDLLNAFQKVQLVSTQEVYDKARVVFRIVIEGHQTNKLADLYNNSSELNRAVGNFVDAARKELKIDVSI